MTLSTVRTARNASVPYCTTNSCSGGVQEAFNSEERKGTLGFDWTCSSTGQLPVRETQGPIPEDVAHGSGLK